MAVTYEIFFDGEEFHKFKVSGGLNLPDPEDLHTRLVQEIRSKFMSAERNDLFGALKERFKLSLLPSPKLFKIQYEYSADQGPQTKRGRTRVRYDMQLALRDGRAAKFVTVLLGEEVHRFLLPADRELGDFLPIPTGIDPMFDTHHRGQVRRIRPDWHLELYRDALTIEYPHEPVTPEDTVDVTSLYQQVCEELNCDRDDPRHLETASRSIESGNVWFWVAGASMLRGQCEKKPLSFLDADSKAVRAWLTDCCKGIVHERTLETPEVRTSSSSSASAAAASASPTTRLHSATQAEEAGEEMEQEADKQADQVKADEFEADEPGETTHSDELDDSEWGGRFERSQCFR